MGRTVAQSVERTINHPANCKQGHGICSTGSVSVVWACVREGVDLAAALKAAWNNHISSHFSLHPIA
jgi:hypothetical protein